MCVCVYMCVYVCMYVCMYVCIYIIYSGTLEITDNSLYRAVMGSLEALPWSRGVSRQQCVTLVLEMYIKTLALVLDNTIVLVLKLLKTQGKTYCVL